MKLRTPKKDPDFPNVMMEFSEILVTERKEGLEPLPVLGSHDTAKFCKGDHDVVAQADLEVTVFLSQAPQILLGWREVLRLVFPGTPGCTSQKSPS